MNLNDLLKEFGSQTGLGDVCLDENNMCRLIFDDDMVVDIELMPDGRTFYMYSVVGYLPSQKRGEFLKKLLEANLFGRGTGGAAFGLDSDKEQVFLYRKFDCECTDYSSFSAALESMVGALEHWRKEFASWGEGNSEAGGMPAGGAIRA